MTLQPFYIEPGICKNTSAYSAAKTFAYGEGRIATGRYVDGNAIRFVAGFPEKIGGSLTINTTIPNYSPVRAWVVWEDREFRNWIAAGTTNQVWAADTVTGTYTFTDITPARILGAGEGTLTGALTTTMGSAVVAVADTNSFLVNGDWVNVSALMPVGGLIINGWYQVSASVPGTGYSITASSNATSGATGGGGISVSYPRIKLSASPFATTSGLPTVVVTVTNHGGGPGDVVTFAGATAVAGLTLNGAFVMQAPTTANTFTITSGSNANATTTGGGTPTVVFGQSPASGPGGNSIGFTFAVYGYDLLACLPGADVVSIFIFDPDLGGRMHPVNNAPAPVYGIFVTPERFLIALEPLTHVQWPDQNDITEWVPAITTTANDRQLGGQTYFICGVPIRLGASLAFTDRNVFLFNYTGDTFIYQTPLIADNAGIIGPHAVVVYGETAYWMSDSEFWLWNGSVSPLPSDDVREFVFNNLNRANAYKCFAGVNRKFKEVWFFYPSLNVTECDSYVIYHTDQQCWSIGLMSRSAWLDMPPGFAGPITAAASVNLVEQEQGTDADGAAIDSYITTSEVDVTNGTTNVNVFGFLLDTQRQTGNLALTINSRYYPQDTVTTTGPYTLTPPSPGRVDLRVDGKEVGFKLESNVVGGDFRLALPRLDLQPSGARR